MSKWNKIEMVGNSGDYLEEGYCPGQGSGVGFIFEFGEGWLRDNQDSGYSNSTGYGEGYSDRDVDLYKYRGYREDSGYGSIYEFRAGYTDKDNKGWS